MYLVAFSTPVLVYQSISPSFLAPSINFISRSAVGSFSKDFQISSGTAAWATETPIVSPRKQIAAHTNLAIYSIEEFS